MRSGVIAQKVGMTRVFTDAGEHVPVTVLKVDSCQVVAHRTMDKNGYTALQLGVGKAKVKNVSAAERGRFAVAKVEPKRKLAEFRVTEDARDPGRRRDHRRPLHPGPVRRRHRHHHRQGLCRRHEALELRRPARLARRVGLAPLDRLDRRPPGSGQDLQEQEDAGPSRRRARDDAEPARRADRRRARADPRRGRRPRRRRRLDLGPRRRQAEASGRGADAGQVPRSGRRSCCRRRLRLRRPAAEENA